MFLSLFFLSHAVSHQLETLMKGFNTKRAAAYILIRAAATLVLP